MAMVLIVDDSPTEVHVMKTALEASGYETVVAVDGAEAIRLARSDRPNLVLSFVVMPGMNGFEATRALAADPATREIPVIMVTQKIERSDQIWALRQGAIDYLPKPFSTSDLVQKIRAVLSK